MLLRVMWNLHRQWRPPAISSFFGITIGLLRLLLHSRAYIPIKAAYQPTGFHAMLRGDFETLG